MAAVLKLSDWQIGEIINASETEGFGEFNFQIAEKRVFDLIRGFLGLGGYAPQGWIQLIQELHVFSEADLVSGNYPLRIGSNK